MIGGAPPTLIVLLQRLDYFGAFVSSRSYDNAINNPVKSRDKRPAPAICHDKSQTSSDERRELNVE
jgi:hypothetical protein